MRRLFTVRTLRPRPALVPLGPEQQPAALPPICPECQAVLADAPRYALVRVCDVCGYHFPVRAHDRIAQLADPGTFRETAARLTSTDPLDFADDKPYRDRLREQQTRTGQTDALVTGTAQIHGHAVVLAVLDFAFMGGSMGVVVGEKLARAADFAGKKRWPLISVVASGGARMQEGMLSLLQLAKTAAAIQRLRAEGVPFVSVLTNPTTGGVFASFASLGDRIVAEPRALIGFAGPRVVEQTMGEPLPPGSHTAEFLFAHGMIDAVVPRDRLRDELGETLAILTAPRTWPKPATAALTQQEPPDVAPWQIVQDARDATRPTALDYTAAMLDRFVELHGDRCFGDDPAVVAGFGLLAGRPLAVIALERGHGDDAAHRRFGRPYPEGYRKAQRVMRLAANLHLPVLTLVDTPGAYPGLAAEERGLAGQLAETMALMSELPVPIVAAIIGEGGSGGALALALADRVLMQERAIYSVIAPEGAAAILYRDAGRAAEIAPKLKLTAPELKAFGIVDQIVTEPEGGARADPTAAAAAVRAAIVAALVELQDRQASRLIRDRAERYRRIGRTFTREADLQLDGHPQSLPAASVNDGENGHLHQPPGSEAARSQAAPDGR